MSPNRKKELKTCCWIFGGSLLLTPPLVWCFVTCALGWDGAFGVDILDFYKNLFSLHPEAVYGWLILLVPVFFYELGVSCRHYYRNPGELRSVFRFPRKDRK